MVLLLSYRGRWERVPEVHPGAFFGGAVSSDPGLPAVWYFCEVCVSITGVGKVAYISEPFENLGTLGFPSIGVISHLLLLCLVLVGTVFFDRCTYTARCDDIRPRFVSGDRTCG